MWSCRSDDLMAGVLEEGRWRTVGGSHLRSTDVNSLQRQIFFITLYISSCVSDKEPVSLS